MIEIYADGELIFDSRVPDEGILALKVTKALNKGGTATITVPPWHRAYNAVTSYRTIITIYRDGELVFRGRSLYPTNTFEMVRTFTCEGERCFLNDAVLHGRHLYHHEDTKELIAEELPGGGYLYQASPEEIFRDVLAEYNAQVDPFKQFEVGTITVTDPNDYIRLESTEAETVATVIDKLVERCGGYVTFEEGANGQRVINWLASLDHTSEQEIAFGDNLLDFMSTDANTELATVIVPYGAVVNEETGERLTIKDANGGRDYIVASDAAIAERGYIWRAVPWDDVTDPVNLLTKARAYLAESSQMITTLTLTALDLSVLDKSIESFALGDLVKVYSRAHGQDGEPYQLTEMTLDLLNPQNDTLTLGRAIASLTGSDVVATMQASSGIAKARGTARGAYTANDQKMAHLEQTFRSEIEQIPNKIKLSVSGSLGGTASITMSVDGVQTPVGSIDLSGVRRAFANDTSAVTVSAGTIKFSSNTLIVDSTNLKVSEDGTIYATNAVLSGTATTESGLYKSELSAGRLRFAYDGIEMGGIASGYMGDDASVRGVAVRLEADAKYIGFSKIDAEGDGYDLTYCINFGAHPGGRTERHIFHGDAYFGHGLRADGATYLNNKLTVKGHIDIDGAYSLRYKTTTGEIINVIGKYADDDALFVGHDAHDIYVYGTNVVLGSASGGAVNIRGASSHVNSLCTFHHFAYFASNAYFLANTIVSNNTGMKGNTAAGSDTIWMLAVNNLNEVILGDGDYTTYIQGASILIGTGSSTVTVRSNLDVNGAVQFNNGFGVQVKNTSGADCYILSFNASNQVNVGHLDYPMYLRGTSVTVNTGNFTVYQGSVVLSNGYGIQGKDSSGNPYYILSVNASNQVSVGSSSLPLYLRGSGVYLSSTGATVTSDRRKKNSIEELGDAYEAMLDKLTPVRFKYNDGTSGRFHAGFIAQDVKAALEAAGLATSDFGGFVDVNGDGEDFGLIYSEFIALLLHKIKRQEQRIAALEEVRK